MSRRDRRDGESRKRRRSRSKDKDRSPRKEPEKPKDKRHRPSEDDREAKGPGTSESLSIDETNKLRAKLGLAPLNLGNDVSNAGAGDDKSKNSDANFVHAPAKSITNARKAEKIHERISTAKEKRELMNKLREIKSLGAGDEDNATSWVDKMRQKEKAKVGAENREKMFAEMDEEFGLSEIVAENFKVPSTKPEYSSSSLRGLKVEHKVDRFSEGAPIILTLKDSDVLAEDASDILVNVNLVDDEKAEINRLNKRKLAGLGGILQDEDEDVLMGLREKGVLDKYDAEISGPKKAEFTLQAGGSYASEQERAMERLQQELQNNRQTIEDREQRIASEFYTASEMEQFNKRRVKKRKVQRRVLRADDLIPAEASETLHRVNSEVAADHGSRSRARRSRDIAEEGEVEDINNNVLKSEVDAQPNKTFATFSTAGLDPSIAALLSVQSVYEEQEEANNQQNDDYDQWTAEQLEPDDLDMELEKTLNRVRNANLAKSVPQSERPLRVKMEPEVASTSRPDDGSLVFDATAEFFKQISGGLQHDVDAKMVKKKKEEEEATMEEAEAAEEEDEDRLVGITTASQLREDFEKERKRRERNRRRGHDGTELHSSSSKTSSRRSRREEDEEAAVLSGRRDAAMTMRGSFAPTAEENRQSGVFEEEPQLNQGIFSALVLAQRKGYVETQKEKERPVGQLINLMAKNFVTEDIRYDDIDAKFAKRERYNGAKLDFRDKPDYKPEVKLHYVDEMGRDLTPKEAFRQLSHKFHGKGSGKKKIEKRTNKILEEALIKNSASSDTPLGTLDKLNKKLERQGMPYVVLSGKGSATKSLMK